MKTNHYLFRVQDFGNHSNSFTEGVRDWIPKREVGILGGSCHHRPETWPPEFPGRSLLAWRPRGGQMGVTVPRVVDRMIGIGRVVIIVLIVGDVSRESMIDSSYV